MLSNKYYLFSVLLHYVTYLNIVSILTHFVFFFFLDKGIFIQKTKIFSKHKTKENCGIYIYIYICIYNSYLPH